MELRWCDGLFPQHRISKTDLTAPRETEMNRMLTLSIALLVTSPSFAQELTPELLEGKTWVSADPTFASRMGMTPGMFATLAFRDGAVVNGAFTTWAAFASEACEDYASCITVSETGVLVEGRYRLEGGSILASDLAYTDMHDLTLALNTGMESELMSLKDAVVLTPPDQELYIEGFKVSYLPFEPGDVALINGAGFGLAVSVGRFGECLTRGLHARLTAAPETLSDADRSFLAAARLGAVAFRQYIDGGIAMTKSMLEDAPPVRDRYASLMQSVPRATGMVVEEEIAAVRAETGDWPVLDAGEARVAEVWEVIQTEFLPVHSLTEEEREPFREEALGRIALALEASYFTNLVEEARGIGDEAVEDLICPVWIAALRENTVTVPVEGGGLVLRLPKLPGDGAKDGK